MYLYNMNSVNSMTFSSLTAVNGTMTIRSMQMYAATSFANSFPVLRTVTAQLMVYTVSIAGAYARSAGSFPQLQSVGSLYVRQGYFTLLVFPALTTVGGGSAGQTGQLYLYDMQFVVALQFTALTSVWGQITVGSVSSLTNLCEFGLQQSGYLTPLPVRSPSPAMCRCSHCLIA